MPFCTQCGTQIQPTAAFCGKCGARQPATAAGVATGEEWLRSIAPSTASTLCYVPFVGWVAALIILATQRFREDRLVRFHAFQGLYLFVVWMLVDIAIGSFFGFAGMAVRRAVTGSLKLSVLCAWIFMLYKTSIGELIRLPFLGELAERSVAEQSSGRS
ncbi:MAG: zinc-ribbon domain-containing protein [Bryobacteraceae bacterium]